MESSGRKPARVLRLLLVEKSTAEAEQIMRSLEESGFSVECRRVDSAIELRQALDETAWDAVLGAPASQAAAEIDSLTGLANRAAFMDWLTIQTERARTDAGALAILLIGIDNFKGVNESLGHAVGDQLLIQVGRRLAESLQPGEFTARLGGDEFLLAKRLPHENEAAATANQVIQLLQGAFQAGDHTVHTTVSAGAAVFPRDGHDAEALLRHADSAYYRAKHEGKNAYKLYQSSMSLPSLNRWTLEHSIRRGLRDNEFILHYQPIIDLRTGRVSGMEALVRWEVPGFGLVAPMEFIPIAEESGLIIPLGEWVLRTACAQVKAWQKKGLTGLRVAINLSGRQLNQRDLPKTIEKALADTGLDAWYLTLEITESYAMQNADFTVGLLRELKDMGVDVAIDDFGTGYSSLAYLKRFPIDTLKIDRSFVRDLSTDPNDEAIATAIIALAHSLNLHVVAEGVETQAQLNRLCQYHCDFMQGFLFSKPLTGADFENLILSGKGLELKAA